MSAKLLVIADDLTGALDTAVQFAARGVRTQAGFGALEIDAEVIAVDLDSRHDAPETAAEKVRRLIARARRIGIPYLYKKTDSALRGNLGAELEAALGEAGARQLPFVPAYPANGRTTVGGLQYIDGVPLDRSPAGRDPFWPASTARVAEILARQSALPVRTGTWRDPPAGDGICVYDAADAADLRRIAEHLRDRGQLRLTAGCAGFAALLPDALGLSRAAAPAPIAPKSVLIVSGSAHEASIRQMAHMKMRGAWALTLARGAPSARQVAEHLNADGIALIEAVDRAPAGALEGRGEMRARIAQLAKEVCQIAEVGALLVIGGDTLRGILEALGIDAVAPLRELLPGIVLARGGGRAIIAKSGGFGGADAIERTLEKL